MDSQFKLNSDFIKEQSKKPNNFGFNGLGELVYLRTYSRLLPDGSNEKWYQTVKRVVEGTYQLQKDHIDSLSLGWDEEQAQKSAQEMYTRMFEMKFLPPGRGLWAMGTDIINKKGLAASLNNCGFISTKDIDKSFSTPFIFLMDMSMLGVGVGFDTEGEAKIIIKHPEGINSIHEIEDTREGWVNSTKLLLESYSGKIESSPITFDYSNIRPAGIPLKTFGGLSSGPQPLIDLHSNIKVVLEKNINLPITVTTIVDIMNLIGKCVVSGNIRRCLPKGTLIHTIDGLVPIEDVKSGTFVYTSKGLSPTKDHIYQGIQKVLSIFTELGEFRCTRDHKIAVYTQEGEPFIWKKAYELVNSDSLVFPMNLVQGRNTIINEYIIVNSEIAWVIGFLQGYGYSNESGNESSNSSNSSSNEYFEKFIMEIIKDKKIENTYFTEYIKKYYSKSKEYLVPEFILKGTELVRREYLAGLTLSNLKIGFNEITNANLQFMKQVQCLYGSLGITSCLSKQIRNLTLEDNSIIYHLKVINLKGDSNGIVPIRVHGIIESNNFEETYDISVPEYSEFICEAGLLVHNTAEIAFGKKDSIEFMDLKDYSLNPQRMNYGWTSNNSIFAELGMDYTEIAKRICINGEPGLAWLENMRSYSRMVDKADYIDYRVMGGNPCLEQSLESYELCCVTFDTRIQTKTGSPKIIDTVGIPIEIWNGVKWSNVIPFKTSNESEIYRIILSDGSYLDCTSNHKWSIKNGKKGYKEVETINLKIKDKLELFSLTQSFEGINDPNAFELGLFAGDGYIDNNTPMITLYGNKLKLKNLININGKFIKEQFNKNYKDPFGRVSFKNILDLKICEELNNKKKGLPDYIYTLDKTSILKFIAGYIETDGSIRTNKNPQHYVIYGSELKMRDLQILLRRVGIDHATIRLMSPKGFKTNKGIRNQDLYSLCIPSFECKEIPTILKKANIFANGETINNAYPENKKISNKSIQKIKNIIKLEIKQPTYCFTEPETHKGVFGNVITHQCLVETFPTKADSLEDYLRTLKFAYLYAKTVTLGLTHWSETNRVQLRNRRIGCSVSGIAQFLAKNNLHTLNQWLDFGYHTIKHWDTIYSEWLCIPKSIKTTSIKPSGTVSLLAGVTPGMHYPESRFYIRRMRLSKLSPLVPELIKAGYHVEPAVGSEEDTVVVEIPVDVGEGIRTINEVSMWEQVALAANMQRWWADNQVSCTVTFKPETEGSQIASVLDYFQYYLKGISFLPKCDYGAYPQMPYEEITEERYLVLLKSISKINLNNNGIDGEGEMYCDSTSCTLVK